MQQIFGCQISLLAAALRLGFDGLGCGPAHGPERALGQRFVAALAPPFADVVPGASLAERGR